MNSVTQILTSKAEDKFGAERAAQLRAEIEQLAAELARLREAVVEIEDEP